jgi:hypothetical protein
MEDTSTDVALTPSPAERQEQATQNARNVLAEFPVLDFGERQYTRVSAIENMASLIGAPTNEQTERIMIQYVNQAFMEYCQNNNVRPANVPGYTGLNQSIIEHVAHDETTDAFTVTNRVRTFDIGRNAWISDCSINRDTGSIDMTVAISNITARPADIGDGFRMSWRPIDPRNITVRDLRFLNGQVEFVYDNCTNPEFKDLSPKRRALRRKLYPGTSSRGEYAQIAGYSDAEKNALDTLREMISEADFRKYLKYGFVLVEGASGKIYQVYRSRAHTKVWENGKIVEEICVRISDHNIPLTDNVIAFMSMILASEDEFKKLGNVYNMREAA